MQAVFTTNITIYTGADFAQTFVLEDTQANTLMNLANYSGCAQMKRFESSIKTADFSIQFASDPTTGRVGIEMLRSVTSTLKPGKYFWDLLLNSPTGTTTRVVEGTAIVKKSVTR
tara:strand:+ start:1315 stop:1659 length:345 start_codon:yes stop_codon:yes gene_type:complete